MNIFFDLDGTVADSRADLAKAVNMTRAHCGLAPVPVERVMECVGDGVRSLLERAIPERAADAESLIPVQAANYATCWLDETSLYPGVRETLEELKRRGWNIALVSNKPEKACREILEGLGVLRFFGAVVGGGTVPELKPSPEPLRAAASRMRSPLKSKDWMVGDNWTDLAAAEAAGVRSAFCRWGFGKLRDGRYNIAISNMREILRYCPDREEY